jgi:hypothetical protein
MLYNRLGVDLALLTKYMNLQFIAPLYIPSSTKKAPNQSFCRRYKSPPIPHDLDHSVLFLCPPQIYLCIMIHR